jgi:hypothetical protein
MRKYFYLFSILTLIITSGSYASCPGEITKDQLARMSHGSGSQDAIQGRDLDGVSKGLLFQFFDDPEKKALIEGDSFPLVSERTDADNRPLCTYHVPIQYIPVFLLHSDNQHIPLPHEITKDQLREMSHGHAQNVIPGKRLDGVSKGILFQFFDDPAKRELIEGDSFPLVDEKTDADGNPIGEYHVPAQYIPVFLLQK